MWWMFLESVDKIQGLVENKFQDIRNTDRNLFRFPGQPCTSEHLQVCTSSMWWQRVSSDTAESRKEFFPFFSNFPSLYFLLQILARAVPIKQGHKLRIGWPITPSVHHYKEAPGRYISHLIGHESEGSLFYILKTLGRFCLSLIFLILNVLAAFGCILKLFWFENLTKF